MNICQCGAQAGCLHERDCPWPLFTDDPERVARWMEGREAWRACWISADADPLQRRVDEIYTADRAQDHNEGRAELDPEYADVDEAGQLALGVPGEPRAIPGLAKPRPAEHPTFDL